MWKGSLVVMKPERMITQQAFSLIISRFCGPQLHSF